MPSLFKAPSVHILATVPISKPPTEQRYAARLSNVDAEEIPQSDLRNVIADVLIVLKVRVGIGIVGSISGIGLFSH